MKAQVTGTPLRAFTRVVSHTGIVATSNTTYTEGLRICEKDVGKVTIYLTFADLLQQDKIDKDETDISTT